MSAKCDKHNNNNMDVWWVWLWVFDLSSHDKNSEMAQRLKTVWHFAWNGCFRSIAFHCVATCPFRFWKIRWLFSFTRRPPPLSPSVPFITLPCTWVWVCLCMQIFVAYSKFFYLYSSLVISSLFRAAFIWNQTRIFCIKFHSARIETPVVRIYLQCVHLLAPQRELFWPPSSLFIFKLHTECMQKSHSHQQSVLEQCISLH